MIKGENDYGIRGIDCWNSYRIVFTFISYQIGIKENITLLHGYHYTQLDPKDKKVFTKKIGIGTLLVSIGILVMPIINLISHSELGYYTGLILIVVGVFYIIFIIVKYNGKLISFKK